MKAGRTEHLRYFLSRARRIDEYWQAYKITLRRGYDITDIALWCDCGYAQEVRQGHAQRLLRLP